MIKQVLFVSLALGLAACASTEVGMTAGETPLGAAVRQNIAAQTVNPAGSSAPVTHSAARTAKAVTAYQGDKVEKPADVSSMSSGSASGSGGN